MKQSIFHVIFSRSKWPSDAKISWRTEKRKTLMHPLWEECCSILLLFYTYEIAKGKWAWRKKSVSQPTNGVL